MMQDFKLSSRKLFVIVIILSFISGGLAGGSVGFVSGASGQIVNQDLAGGWNWLLSKAHIKPNQNLNNNEKKEVIKVEEESATIAAVEKVMPAVVSITITKELRQYNPDDWFPFNDFFGFPFPKDQRSQSPRIEKRQIGGGTGFIIDSQAGLILTNRHVVADEDAEYTVVTSDDKEYQAEVLARDPFNDLAVVKVKDGLKDYPEVVLGDSSNLKLGQKVIAIGNSLGQFRNTVTTGVVSGIGRDIVAGGIGTTEKLEGVIQTDAAINPGNSGGPLVDLQGEVIGINTAISQQGQLIGFAIPINSAKQVIKSVKKYGKIVRPFLGVRYIMIDDSIAKKNNLPFSYGALIIRGQDISDLAVVPGGPADKAGLVENDIVLEVDGVKVKNNNTLSRLIQKHSPGDKVNLLVWHKGEKKKVTVTLEEYKQ